MCSVCVYDTYHYGPLVLCFSFPLPTLETGYATNLKEYLSFPSFPLLTNSSFPSFPMYVCDTPTAPSRLRKHIRYRHVSNKTHQCPLCHKTYKTADSLSAHIEIHGDYRAKCKWAKCSYVARSEKLMRAHEYSVHRNGQDERVDLFCCHVCVKRYPFGRNLTVHLKKEHHFVLPPGHCRFRLVREQPLRVIPGRCMFSFCLSMYIACYEQLATPCNALESISEWYVLNYKSNPNPIGMP